jgi:DNA-binding SARP family transcriptional activator
MNGRGVQPGRRFGFFISVSFVLIESRVTSAANTALTRRSCEVLQEAVDLRLLGPLEVLDDAGRPIELRRKKQRALLAALALRPGQVVSTDRLLEDLWGEQPPRTATGSLQNLVSQLRRTLGSDVLVTRPPGYVLAVEPDRTDLGRFTSLAAAAAKQDPSDRVATLAEALELWRGPALADVAFEPFAQTEAPRLEELHTAAREQLVEAELALGRHADLVPLLEDLVDEQPFRERLRALLMLALYRSGRQADALEAFAATRRFLRSELGLEPSPALKALQAGILRQDPALDPAAPEPLAGLPGEERRKTVTVVFADVVDSTVLGASLDPEAYRGVLRRYYRSARAVLEQHGGAVEKFIGDAVVAVFGIPHQHEDDALRAVRAAVELQARVTELNAELERAHGVTIRIRLGIDTGEAIVGDLESGQSFATGHAVNVAAKLQQAAGAGGVLIGAATYGLVRDAVAAEVAEPLTLGGRAAPIAAFRVASVTTGGPGVARHLGARLVGRDEELAALREEFDRACAGGECRLVTVLGEAGIGKTRLANELSASVGDDATVLVGHCISYGEGATYLPIAEVVRAVVSDGSEAAIAALLADDSDARVVARRVRELLGWAEGAPPAGEGVWAVRRLLEALARVRPLVLVLEDIHWAEPTLLDLVEYLAARDGGAPILVLCLARPDLLEARAEWPVPLRLGPLSQDASAQLLDDLAGGTDVPDDQRRRIVEIAEGNALFAEQLLAHVVESGEAALDAVPASVDALVASRLDRLPDDERGVLERAAVVGRDFWPEAVADLSERDVGPELEALTTKGLVRASRSDEHLFRFHHVLIRDVAYAGITKERRSHLHERVAQWLDGREAGRDEIVGYHLEQAYRYRTELGPADEAAQRLGQAAGEKLGAAGMRAWKRSDAPAASNLLGRSASLLPVSERRAEVLCEFALAQRLAGGSTLRQTLEEAFDIAVAAGSRRTELRARVELAYAGLYGVGGLQGTAEAVLEAASVAIPVLEEVGDDRALGRAWYAVAEVQNMRLNNRARGEAAATALRHYRRTGFSPSLCLTGQAAALYHGPTAAPEAIRRCEQLIEEAADDRQATASVRLFVAGLRAMRNEFDEARRLTDEAQKTFEELGASFSVAGAARGVRADIERLAGDLAAAERQLRVSRNALEALEQEAYVATRDAQLADVLYEQGRVEEAESFVQRAQAESLPEDVITQVFWRTTRARLLARRGAVADAEALGHEALLLLAETDVLNQRAKATLDLADVLRLSRRSPDEVRALVREAISLYRAKGNLAAMATARALLDEPVTAPT